MDAFYGTEGASTGARLVSGPVLSLGVRMLLLERMCHYVVRTPLISVVYVVGSVGCLNRHTHCVLACV